MNKVTSPLTEIEKQHDSTKGYSHGCIEVEGRLFSMLENYRRSSKKNTMTIKVAYVKGRPTNGGTKK